jgi:hypothetical protein
VSFAAVKRINSKLNNAVPAFLRGSPFPTPRPKVGYFLGDGRHLKPKALAQFSNTDILLQKNM